MENTPKCCDKPSWAYVSGQHIEGTTVVRVDTSLLLKCRSCGMVTTIIIGGPHDLTEIKNNLGN